MKALNLYKKYKIMPTLQAHMLRVAAVASIICDNLEISVNKNNIVTACLLHDMGNIIKFKLSLFPQFLEPEGLEYWQDVQNEFKQEYGDKEDEATYRIVQEITDNAKVLNLVKSIAFAKAPENYKHNNYEKKICAYADMRVIPTGITNAKDRMEEGRKRYLANKNLKREDVANFLDYSSHILKIEKQVFSKAKIKPDYITNKNVFPLMRKLEDFETSS